MMTDTTMRAILLGGRPGTDGLFPFQRHILFYPAGTLVASALPEDCVPLYLRHPEEPELPGVESRVSVQPTFAGLLAEALRGLQGDVLVFTAPMPDVRTGELETLLARHRQYRSGGTLLACKDSSRSYACGVFRAESLRAALERDPRDLLSCAKAMLSMGCAVFSCRIPKSRSAVVTACDASRVQRRLMLRINRRFLEQGVAVFDPKHTYISPDCVIAPGTEILPDTMIYPGCVIGAGCSIGPNSVLKQAHIGDRCVVNASQVVQSRLGDGVTVGPFANIRPDCTVQDGVHIGDFVELKNAAIGQETMISHLTYIGDADIGARVNFGCGTVVVNYDGVDKHRTTVGDDCFVGCNTNLVAPVRLGDRAFTAAGTTVTENVPEGSLAIGRARQTTKPGWNDRRRKTK